MTAPVLSDLDAPTFDENIVNATPQLIDSDVTLVDPEGDFDGGMLSVTGMLAEDRISIQNSGSITYYSAFGGVSYNGTMIGVVQDVPGKGFYVSFNLDATTAGVEAVIEHLTYANTSDTPTATRALSISVTDAVGAHIPSFPNAVIPTDIGGAPIGTGIGDPTLIDLDNDGDLDLVLGSATEGQALYYENVGTAQDAVFEARTGASNPLAVLATGGVYNISFADLDGDGDQDAFYNANTLRYAENVGDAEHPVFTANATNPLPQLSGSAPNVQFGDFDADGDLDAIGSEYFAPLRYFENTGTVSAPVFVELTGGQSPVNGVNLSFAQNITLGDLDNDGDIDLFIGKDFGSVYFENTGTAYAPIFTDRGDIISFVVTYTNVAFSDLDGDGDLDIFFGSGNPNDTRYFENTMIDAAPSVTITVKAQSEPISGGGGSQTLPGSTGDDFLNGDAGDDTLKGGLGDDTLDGGADKDNLQGGDGNDTLLGGDGDDTLNGGPGADALAGGDGNDLYIVDGDDTATESSGEGADTVQSSADWTLGANFEDLTLTGTANLQGVGNDENNILIGNGGDNSMSGRGGDDTITGNNGADFLYGEEGDDTLTGGAGDDVLIGGDGIDTMKGGAGNDRYYIDADDIISEAGASGIDTVFTSINGYTLLTGFENLTMQKGWETQDAYGNSYNNVIHGNHGANRIEGFAGADQLFGDYGSDVLLGGIGNDRLDGGEDADEMRGGVGSDTYVIDNVRDVVIEAANEGIDTIESSISLKLVVNVEHLVLTRGGDINGDGNALANTITGNDANNILNGGTGDDKLYGQDGLDTLIGGAGNDVLDGGEGLDTLFGGAGNDIYILGEGDIASETGAGGIDTVRTAIDGYRLADGIEKLEMTGNYAQSGYGNSLANVMHGSYAANLLEGLDGNDQLFGGDGGDQLFGGAGADKLYGGSGGDYLDGGDGNDVLDGGGIPGEKALAGRARMDRDVLHGGGGNDTYTGGVGASTFLVLDSDMVLSSRGGLKQTDTILDLNFDDGDRIDLSRIDADVLTDGQQLFHFVTGFSKHAGEAKLAFNAATKMTTLQLDIDGDGKVDYQLNIRGDATHGDILAPNPSGDAGGWILEGWAS